MPINPQDIVFFDHNGRLINPQPQQDGSVFFRLYFDQTTIDVWDTRQLYLVLYDNNTNTYSGIGLDPNEKIIIKLIQNYKYPIFVLYAIGFDPDNNIYFMQPTDEMIFDDSNTDASKPIQINVAFSPMNELLYSALIEIYYDDGVTQTKIATIEIKGKGYERDHRVESWLSNKGIKVHKQDLWMFRDYNIYEYNEDYKVSDRYKKALYTHYHDVFPYAGTIKALRNLIKITGWSQLVNVSQLHKKADKYRFIDVFDLERLYQNRQDGWVKDKILAITFDMSSMTTDNIHETFYKLTSLKNFAQRYIIPIWFDVIVVGEKQIVLYSRYANTKHSNPIFYVGSFNNPIVYKDVFPFRYVISQYVDFTCGGSYDYSGLPFTNKINNPNDIIINIQNLRKEIFSHWINTSGYDPVIINKLESIYKQSIDSLEGIYWDKWQGNFDTQRVYSIDDEHDYHKKAIPIVLHFDIPTQNMIDFDVVAIHLFVEVIDVNGNQVHTLLFENISNNDLYALPLYLPPVNGHVNVHILFETNTNNNIYFYYERYIELKNNTRLLFLGLSQKANHEQQTTINIVQDSDLSEMELLYYEFEKYDRLLRGKDNMIRLWLKQTNIDLDFSTIHILQKYQPLDPLPRPHVQIIDQFGTHDLVSYQNDNIKNPHVLYGYRKFKGVIIEQLQNWTIESVSKYRIDDFCFHDDIVPIIKIYIDKNNITSLSGYKIIINDFKPYTIQTTTNDPQDLTNELANSDFQPFTWFSWEYITPSQDNPYDPNFGVIVGKAKDFTDLRTWVVMEILDPSSNPASGITYTKYSFPEPYWLFRDDYDFDVINGYKTMLDWLSSYWSFDPELLSLDLDIPYHEYSNLNTRQDLMNFVIQKEWLSYNDDNTEQQGHLIPSVSFRDSFSIHTNPQGIDLYVDDLHYHDSFIGFVMPIGIDIHNTNWYLYDKRYKIINNPFLFLCVNNNHTQTITCEIQDWFDTQYKDFIVRNKR